VPLALPRYATIHAVAEFLRGNRRAKRERKTRCKTQFSQRGRPPVIPKRVLQAGRLRYKAGNQDADPSSGKVSAV
jgi:hypothetical protein